MYNIQYTVLSTVKVLELNKLIEISAYVLNYASQKLITDDSVSSPYHVNLNV